MGTLRSTTQDPTGHTYNGVLLGDPVELDGDPNTFEWDDSAFPNGTCEVVDGELVVAVDELSEPIDITTSTTYPEVGQQDIQ